MHFLVCSLVDSWLGFILYCVLKGENIILLMPILYARDLKKYALKIGCCVIGIWMLANGKC